MREIAFTDPHLDATAVVAAEPSRPEDLLTIWLAHLVRAHYTDLREQAAAAGVAETITHAEQRLAAAPEATALQALQAGRRLGDYLADQRTAVVSHGRQAGASWADIGAALGMSKQAAHEAYRDVDRDSATGELPPGASPE